MNNKNADPNIEVKFKRLLLFLSIGSMKNTRKTESTAKYNSVGAITADELDLSELNMRPSGSLT
jgi:hypothetical protein